MSSGRAGLDLGRVATIAIGAGFVRTVLAVSTVMVVLSWVGVVALAPVRHDLAGRPDALLVVLLATAAVAGALLAALAVAAWLAARLTPAWAGRALLAILALVAALLVWEQVDIILTQDAPSPVWDLMEIPWAVFAGLIFLEVSILAFLAAGARPHELAIARETRWSRKRLLSRVLLAPPAFARLAKGRGSAMALYILGFALLALVTGGLIGAGRASPESSETFVQVCSQGNPARIAECAARAQTSAYAGALFGLVVLAPAAIFGGVAMGRGLIGAARRRVVRSTAEALAADRRPPILFLRAFQDDQVELAGGFWTPARWFLQFGRARAPLDHLLVEEFGLYGPVVALGKVTRHGPERFAPFGAARVYCDHSNWKAEVRRRALEAAAIVMCLSDEDSPDQGVGWELGFLANPQLRQKTLFVVRPRARRASANTRAWATAAQLSGFAPAPGKGPWLCHFQGPQGEALWGRGGEFSRIEYLMALRWFFRARFAEPAAE